MIVESIAAAVTVVVVSSLLFARWAVAREDRRDGAGEALTLQKQRKLLVSLRAKAYKQYLRESGTTAMQAHRRVGILDDEIAKLDDVEVRRAQGKA